MSHPPTFNALVLAGSRGASDPVAASRGLTQKCLVPAFGVPMLCRVLDTLTASPAIGRIFVVLQNARSLADEPTVGKRLAGAQVALLEGGATPSLSVSQALATAGVGFPWLVTTADHPLLTPDIVSFFQRASTESLADVTAGLTPSRVLLASYPESRRTWLRFRDERYSGANLFGLLTPRAEAAVRFWRRVEQERKRPWRMARAFGIGSLVLYALGRLSLTQAMQRVSRVMGCEADAITLPFAEAAIDVDKPDDLDLVEAALARRTS